MFITHIKPVLKGKKESVNKDQNHYYYNIFLEKFLSVSQEIMAKIVFVIIIMLRFGQTKKEGFYGAKKPITIWIFRWSFKTNSFGIA